MAVTKKSASLPDHPSVAAKPGEDVLDDSNRIDFNTPSGLESEQEQVEKNLAEG